MWTAAFFVAVKLVICKACGKMGVRTCVWTCAGTRVWMDVCKTMRMDIFNDVPLGMSQKRVYDHVHRHVYGHVNRVVPPHGRQGRGARLHEASGSATRFLVPVCQAQARAVPQAHADPRPLAHSRFRAGSRHVVADPGWKHGQHFLGPPASSREGAGGLAAAVAADSTRLALPAWRGQPEEPEDAQGHASEPQGSRIFLLKKLFWTSATVKVAK